MGGGGFGGDWNLQGQGEPLSWFAELVLLLPREEQHRHSEAKKTRKETQGIWQDSKVKPFGLFQMDEQKSHEGMEAREIAQSQDCLP